MTLNLALEPGCGADWSGVNGRCLDENAKTFNIYIMISYEEIPPQKRPLLIQLLMTDLLYIFFNNISVGEAPAGTVIAVSSSAGPALLYIAALSIIKRKTSVNLLWCGLLCSEGILSSEVILCRCWVLGFASPIQHTSTDWTVWPFLHQHKKTPSQWQLSAINLGLFC